MTLCIMRVEVPLTLRFSLAILFFNIGSAIDVSLFVIYKLNGMLPAELKSSHSESNHNSNDTSTQANHDEYLDYHFGEEEIQESLLSQH